MSANHFNMGAILYHITIDNELRSRYVDDDLAKTCHKHYRQLQGKPDLRLDPILEIHPPASLFSALQRNAYLLIFSAGTEN